MSTVPLIQYDEAPTDVQAVYDDIKQARNVADVNNFWKALANHPDLLRRTWTTLHEVMQPGALDRLTKELIYLAVSMTNNCEYCIHSHTVAAKANGMSGSQYQELLAVVALAHQTNVLATAMQVPTDTQFLVEASG
jgi:AhpD family alkylhydroperoxidase